MDTNLQAILQQLQAEKSIDRDTLISAISSALESAARKSFSHAANVIVEVDSETLNFKVFEIREIVEEVEDETREIALEAALKLNVHAEIGSRLKIATEPKDFGRIAAQTAKQVIIQKIKEAERNNVYDAFKKREGELITGIVKRFSHGNVIVSVDNAEAVVPNREQSSRESFRPGDRIRAYLKEVGQTPRGPQIVLSRSAPELVRQLFDLEVPEIYDGTIEIKALAREAGSRTKVAVLSNDSNVDAVGACVGMKGSRVRAVVEELSGEKIDIVRWSKDEKEFCANALNPADILDIAVDEKSNSILVVVPYDQLSLAIGKRGQNARLASKLIGWNIDIRSDEELAGVLEEDDGESPKTDATETGETVNEVQETAPENPEEIGNDEPIISEDQDNGDAGQDDAEQEDNEIHAESEAQDDKIDENDEIGENDEQQEAEPE